MKKIEKMKALCSSLGRAFSTLDYSKLSCFLFIFSLIYTHFHHCSKGHSQKYTPCFVLFSRGGFVCKCRQSPLTTETRLKVVTLQCVPSSALGGWHPSVSEDNGFAPWSPFPGRAATATVAVEPNPRVAGLLAGRAHKGCVVQGIRCCPHSSALPLHLVFLFQFLFYFDRCRFCGQPPHISVSSQGFKVGEDREMSVLF